MTLQDFTALASARDQAEPIVANIRRVNGLLDKQSEKADWAGAVYVALTNAELIEIFQDGLQKKLASLNAGLAAIPSPIAPVMAETSAAAPPAVPRGHESAVASLQRIQSEIFAWARTNFGVTTVVANQPVILNMISFLGKLCHAVLKSSQGIRGTPEEHATAAQQAANTLARAALIFRERSGMKNDDTGGSIEVRNVQLAAFLGMMEELGEMAGALLGDLDSPINGDSARAKEVKDGVGDLQVYLLDFCASNGLDAEGCLNTTWAKVSQRDWKKDKLKGGETSDG